MRKTLMKDDNLSNYFSVSGGMGLLHNISLLTHSSRKINLFPLCQIQNSNASFHYLLSVKYRFLTSDSIISLKKNLANLGFRLSSALQVQKSDSGNDLGHSHCIASDLALAAGFGPNDKSLVPDRRPTSYQRDYHR